MGKKPKAPKAPDPYATAAAQTKSNLETARTEAQLNRTNQVGPYGSSTWSNVGDHWTNTINLDPRLQSALNSQMDLQGKLYNMANSYSGRVADALNQPFNLDGLPQLTTDFSGDRQRVEQDLYNRGAKYMDKQWANDLTALEQNLADRGIGRGNPLYNRELENYRKSRADAYGDLQSRAIQAGGSEQSRLYGITADARGRGIQERLMQRNQPLQELAALLGSGGTPEIPQFSQAPGTNVQGVDLGGLINQQYQSKMQNYQNKMNSRGQMMGGLFGLGSSLLTGGLF
ncbi:MAG: hypothetical protein JNK86_04695 [Alphaproteobacteria bacterium]|nr:hypothetical protein [Alphaproteobacteria bacterium]